jgi:hypothetical protein
MFSCNRFDVLVVGARCAGAATAMLMARHGMNVLAIDRGSYGSDTISTHALMRGGVLQLHRWGVLPRLIAAGTPPVRTTTFHYGAERLEVAIKPTQGLDALYAPRRTVLDATLADTAREAGVDIRHGYLLASLRQGSDGRVNGAVVVDPAGNRHEIAADLVIGADGIGSRVAQLAGAAMLREAACSSAVIYGHWDGIEPAGYRWHYAPGVSAGVIPTNDGRHCVFAAVPASRFRTDLRHDQVGGYRRVLNEAAPGLADSMAASALETRLWAFAGRKGYMRQACGPGHDEIGNWVSQRRVPRNAEHAFSSRIELDDVAILINNDYAIKRRCNNGGVQCLAALKFGQIAGKDKISVHLTGVVAMRQIEALHEAWFAVATIWQPAFPLRCLAGQGQLAMRRQLFIVMTQRPIRLCP